VSDPVIRLSRPPDGRIMCCICFRYRQVADLLIDRHGDRWDICGDGTCAAEAGFIDGEVTG
jgi:hypothetical protein